MLASWLIFPTQKSLPHTLNHTYTRNRVCVVVHTHTHRALGFSLSLLSPCVRSHPLWWVCVCVCIGFPNLSVSFVYSMSLRLKNKTWWNCPRVFPFVSCQCCRRLVSISSKKDAGNCFDWKWHVLDKGKAGATISSSALRAIEAGWHQWETFP
jgi:hypothetical protein